MPDAKPSPAADPTALEGFLRERFPDAIGATEEEIATAEARLKDLVGEVHDRQGVDVVAHLDAGGQQAARDHVGVQEHTPVLRAELQEPRWDRPLITRTTLEGNLGPVP